MTLSSKIKSTLKKNDLIVNSFYKIYNLFRLILYKLSPVLLYKFLFRKKIGKWPNLKKPRTFDEKLGWLMLYWRHPLKVKCADKYAVRLYVKEHGLEHMLPELSGVYEKSNEIDFDALPERFVLKCTHGSKMNIICRNKRLLDLRETKMKLDKWMKMDISKLAGEVHYALIEPRIICESYLDDLTGDLPTDYKVYCFDGKAHCTMVCTERGSNNTKFDYYDREWKNELPYSKSSLNANREIPKPEAYEEIINAAEKLSKPFPFVRMDFYSINGKGVFGEMTFTPNGCIDTGYTDLAQKVLGEMINLPEKRFK